MWVSKKSCEDARQYDVLTYLRFTNPGELQRVSCNEYCLRDHDSFRISNGKWHWWSQGKAGHTAVDYLVVVRGYSFPNAVLEVLRAMKGVRVKVAYGKATVFNLPPKSVNNEQARKYLATRGINPWLISMLETDRLIYEDANHHGVIFIGNDYEGNAKHAAYRATDGTNRKGDIRGSNKKYCFKLPYKASKVLHVFEGPVDLLSYVSLCIMDGNEWQSDDMITMCGVSCASKSDGKLPAALEEYLKNNANLEMICLHLDNDEAGRNATKCIMNELESAYYVVDLPPKWGKDYNEYLMMVSSGGDYGRANND